MKILHSADYHIWLNRKKVPFNWQVNRFNLLFNRLLELEQGCDIHIIAGDVFEKKPTMEEQNLFATFANRVQKRTIIIPGNHEASKKGESFLQNYRDFQYAINNPLVEIYTKNTRVEHRGIWFQLFPYGEMQKDNMPPFHEGDILIAHIRGEIPPHTSEEFDFERLRSWKLILLGDIHTNLQYKDFPAYYSGSPLNTAFTRDETKQYGINIVNLQSIDNYQVDFIPLNLPLLIRRKVKVSEKEKIVPDPVNYVVYEVEGSLSELATIERSELVDKKIAENISNKSKLNLSNKTLLEELSEYLAYIKIEDKVDILSEFSNLGISINE